ncbi:heart- and neural crest derivatives-expressed protein 1-like [Uloborus diversus]|uniref:heart- and neural crest derivatives-expressed protein 1-like n=1 Tax=Uloborus diversus TaxID=327109 RepID=UPI002409CAFC|nr:heart- and neural crest derivatives-expressed protein 1-like [Uloborus diversus]
MSGPSSGVNRFPAAAAFGAAPADAAAFLELTNQFTSSIAAATDFAYDAFGIVPAGFRHHHHHHQPPPAHHTSGFGYFSAAEEAGYAASLAWDHHQQTLAAYQQQAGGFATPTSADFAPFSLQSPRGISAMGVQQQQQQQRLNHPSSRIGGAAKSGGKTRRRVATVAQRRAANIRERRRMFNLNSAFDKLRKKVPTFAYEKRLSRIETLRLAIMYIAFMTEVIRGGKGPDHHDMPLVPPGAYTAGSDLWTPPHGNSVLNDAQRPDRLSHICSRQV